MSTSCRARSSRTDAPRQAVILAAGLGSRLGSSSRVCPKCLVEVGGEPLLRHHLRAFHELGVHEICVVVGHLADMVRSRGGADCVFIENSAYARTNSLVSLWMVRHWIRGAVLIVNGDVLAHPAIYAKVASTAGNALAFDSTSGQDAEHMKVEVRDGMVTAISKSLGPARSRGENVGILKFDADGAAALMRAASGLVRAGGVNLWAPAAIDALLREWPVQGIDIAGLPWAEIDYREDLRDAEARVWPAILADRSAQRHAARLERRKNRGRGSRTLAERSLLVNEASALLAPPKSSVS